MFLGIKIAKLGYFNGNPELVLQAPCDVVIQILKFEAMENKYNECYRSLNEHR